MTERTLAGSCLCGAVRYEVADAFEYALICHGSNCRRATGSAFKPFGGIPRDRLRLTRGADNLMIFGDAPTHDATAAAAARSSTRWSATSSESRRKRSSRRPQTAPRPREGRVRAIVKILI
ncbi:MAG: GFA family protein [Amaricoccus sp.]